MHKYHTEKTYKTKLIVKIHLPENVDIKFRMMIKGGIRCISILSSLKLDQSQREISNTHKMRRGPCIVTMWCFTVSKITKLVMKYELCIWHHFNIQWSHCHAMLRVIPWQTRWTFLKGLNILPSPCLFVSGFCTIINS